MPYEQSPFAGESFDEESNAGFQFESAKEEFEAGNERTGKTLVRAGMDIAFVNREYSLATQSLNDLVEAGYLSDDEKRKYLRFAVRNDIAKLYENLDSPERDVADVIEKVYSETPEVLEIVKEIIKERLEGEIKDLEKRLELAKAAKEKIDR